MLDASPSVYIPQTLQEQEEAIDRYRNSEWNQDLLQQWQAIRLAALAQTSQTQNPELQWVDRVAGEDSY